MTSKRRAPLRSFMRSAGGHGGDLRPHRITHPGPLADIREAGQDPVGDAGQHRLAEAGDGVLLMHLHQRHAGAPPSCLGKVM